MEKPEKKNKMLDRREFVAATSAAGVLMATGISAVAAGSSPVKSKVYLIKGTAREEMIPKVLDMLGREKWNAAVGGRSVVLKPNFNSPHPFPGVSHPDTLRLLINEIRISHPSSLKIVDRSGMAKTRDVMDKIGATELAEEMGVEMISHDDLGKDDMVQRSLGGGHWSRGVEWPKLYEEADSIISTCCLKTHQYGGHFTLSMKNSVGMISRQSLFGNHDYMIELHTSPHQRRMIAEINALYNPAFILLDGLKCFTDGGPHQGTEKEPGVMLGGTDRVAIDAVGVAILRSLGTTPEVSNGPIFELDQIKRAVELGLGAPVPDAIEIVTPDGPSEELATGIRAILNKG